MKALQILNRSPASRDGDSLLERSPSIFTVDRDLYVRHVSLELLNPTHDSRLRKSSTSVAVFNLVATVCGGGVLSLPLAYSIAGIIPATLLMLFSSFLTDFSLYILISCARRTGGRSYGDIARAAYGPTAEIVTTLLLVSLLCFILIAYMVLVRDLWTPIVLFAVPTMGKMFEKAPEGGMVVDGDGGEDGHHEISPAVSNYILLVILALVSPLLLKRDLHSLRHTCYVGFSSLIVLTTALIYRAWSQNVTHPGLFHHDVMLYSSNIEDIIYAFPIVALSFFSSFNVLSVHGSLVNPTRKRMKSVLDASLSLCFVFFYMVGIFGYLFAYQDTRDNIFLNFQVSDKAILLGRIGYAITLMFGLPLVTLPAREAMLLIPDQFRNWKKYRRDVLSPLTESPHIVNGINFDEERPLLLTPKKNTFQTFNKKNNNNNKNTIRPKLKHLDTFEETPTFRKTLPNFPLKTTKPPQDKHHHHHLRPPTCMEYVIHIGSTAGIIAICFIGAVAVPGVATVWSICGSSMAILIGFTIPAACYLKIRARKGVNARSVGAWMLLVFSIVACVVCTAVTVVRLTR